MGRRILAYIIDAIIGTAIVVGVFASVASSEERASALEAEAICDILNNNIDETYACVNFDNTVLLADSGDIGVIVLSWIAFTLANFLILPSLTGFSLGKAVVGLRVVNNNTFEKAGFGAHLIRLLLWVADAAPWCFPLVGLITGLSSSGHRRVGDMGASTLVIDKKWVGQPMAVPGANNVVATATPAAFGATPPPFGAAPPPPTPTGSTIGATPPPPPGAVPPGATPPPPGLIAPPVSSSPPPPPSAAPPAASTPPPPPGAGIGAPPSSMPPSSVSPSSTPPSGAPVFPTPATDDPPPPPSSFGATADDSDDEAPGDETDEAGTSASSDDVVDTDLDATTAVDAIAPRADPTDETTMIAPVTIEPDDHDDEPAAPQPPSVEVTPPPAPEPVAPPAPPAPPAPEPEPEPEPPGVGAPQWDEARDTYIQWDPELGEWMEWSESAGAWVPISQ